jgi:hypothetical protein
MAEIHPSAVGLAQSLLGAFALHELPDLASDTLEHRQGHDPR